MSNISLKYIPIHIKKKLHTRVTEHEIVPPWLPVPQDYKYEEHKGQIPLILHHKELNLRI